MEEGDSEGKYPAAAGYAKAVGERDGIPIHPDFLDRMPPLATILDFGCGGGDHARSLARSGHNVYACNPGIGVKEGLPSPGIEEFASSGKITFFNATAESLCDSPEIKDVEFDGIWGQYVLPWVDDVPAALTNLNSRLKEGGTLYVSFFEPFIPGTHSEIFGKNTEQMNTGTVESFARLLEENRLPLKINSCEFLDRSIPPTGSGNRRSKEHPDGKAVENPASILILTKQAECEPGLNIDKNHGLKGVEMKGQRHQSWVERMASRTPSGKCWEL